MGTMLTIVTPQGERYRDTVETVVLPGSEGDFGVLPEHERYLTPLRVGEVEIRAGGDTLFAAIGGGFAEVQAESVTVLVESCELAHDIDTARAELAVARAEQGLASLTPDADEAEVYEEGLRRAKNRLAVGKRRG
jgi:F-type H+-transporting ATPase subunit epsilon